MKFLQVGLGSMGKRRIRCLKYLGYDQITAFDLREDRREEARSLFEGIEVVSTLDDSLFKEADAVIVSTPPDKHTEHAARAADNATPAFIEASVVLEEVQALERHNKGRVFLAPSCTMVFHPVLKEIIALTQRAPYGKVTNFSYHSGQYLPDWHPWEDIRDYYVSNPLTGAAREIVPFELTWITAALGLPTDIKGLFGQSMDMGITLDDVYAFVMRFANGTTASVAVDVVSRFATRSLLINFEQAQLRWHWEDACYTVFEAETNRAIRYGQPEFTAHHGYNKNIGDLMYINEIKAFINAIQNPELFPNSLQKDIEILSLLRRIEESDQP